MKTVPALIIATACLAIRTQAQDSAFTYQGALSQDGQKANGTYQVRFTLHNAETGGSVVAGPITNAPVVVANGLFTTKLDFGAAVFDGNRRWLELGVATNGAENFTTLTPRQEIRATPYAITAARLTGPLPSNGLAGTYSESVSLINPANSFAGDGGGLTNVQALTLSGLTRSELWQLGGNPGTGSNSFLGTTDDRPLELRVNGQRAWRLEPTTSSPNIVGGFSGNYISNAIGATISGGGAEGALNRISPIEGFFWDNKDYSTIGGGSSNAVLYSAHATLAGGLGNSISRADFGALSGGRGNRVGSPGNGGSAHYSFIGGGFGNRMSGTYYSTIGGGSTNSIGGLNGQGDYSHNYSTISGGAGNGIFGRSGAIGGGEGNRIQALCSGSTIGGGLENINNGEVGTIAGGARNVIVGSCDGGFSPNRYSTIGGGAENLIEPGLGWCTISGGYENTIESHFGTLGATISGGRSNIVRNASLYSNIGGGLRNTTEGDCAAVGGGVENFAAATCATIPGGHHNEIGTDSDYSAIGGGQMNLIAGNCSLSTIAGGRANVISANSAHSVIAGGINNEIAPDSSRGFIAGGRGNRIGGNSRDSSIAGGSGNTISTNTDYGTIGGGANNQVNARSSAVPGGRSARTSNYGQMAYASGHFDAIGDAQTSVYVCRGSTSNATPAELFLDGVSQQIAMPTNSIWTFDILVAARASDGTSAAYQIVGAARNNGGITTLAAAPKQNILVEDDPSWNAVPFAAVADNKLAIRVTGSAATSVRWVATIRTTEVTY